MKYSVKINASFNVKQGSTGYNCHCHYNQQINKIILLEITNETKNKWKGTFNLKNLYSMWNKVLLVSTCNCHDNQLIEYLKNDVNKKKKKKALLNEKKTSFYLFLVVIVTIINE